MIFRGKKVLVTGGDGFLGSWLVKELQTKKPAQIIIPRSRRYDLCSRNATERLFQTIRPQVVIHAAAKSGGLGFHPSFPADIFRDNLRMAVNVLDASSRYRVEKLVVLGSSCAYPANLMGGFLEKDMLKGPPHPSIAPFGFSKRALFLGAQAYRQQYGLNAIYLALATLYGPGDTFGTNRTHVVSALIERFVTAQRRGEKTVTCWGTGKAKREFLFVQDAAKAIVKALEYYNSPEPMNIGTGEATSIKRLAELIKGASSFKGNIVWDRSKPDGALHKVLDTSKMKTALKWMPPTTLEKGLERTIAWYRKQYLN